MIDDRELYRFFHHGEAGGRLFDSARIAYTEGEGLRIRLGRSCQPDYNCHIALLAVRNNAIGGSSQEEKASCGESGVDITRRTKAVESDKRGQAFHAETVCAVQCARRTRW